MPRASPLMPRAGLLANAQAHPHPRSSPPGAQATRQPPTQCPTAAHTASQRSWFGPQQRRQWTHHPSPLATHPAHPTPPKSAPTSTHPLHHEHPPPTSLIPQQEPSGTDVTAANHPRLVPIHARRRQAHQHPPQPVPARRLLCQAKDFYSLCAPFLRPQRNNPRAHQHRQ